MKVSMNLITKELREMDIDANYVMSGGNCGTIYIGKVNSDGNYEYAIGPSDYSTATGDTDDLSWGIDGSGVTLQGNSADSSSEFNLATRIALDYLAAYGVRA